MTVQLVRWRWQAGLASILGRPLVGRLLRNNSAEKDPNPARPRNSDHPPAAPLLEVGLEHNLGQHDLPLITTETRLILGFGL